MFQIWGYYRTLTKKIESSTSLFNLNWLGPTFLKMSAEEAAATTPAAEEKKEEEAPVKQARKINRAEKKMREALLKHNLTQLENVTTVTMRRGAELVFTFTQPDVYYLGDVYVVFGESNVQDAASNAAHEISNVATKAAEEEKKDVVVSEEDDANVDTTGLEESDIKMVMEQAKCSKARAVKALRDNNNDMVTAVMSLTV